MGWRARRASREWVAIVLGRVLTLTRRRAALARIAVDDATTVPAPLRQLAGVLLARHIKTCVSVRFLMCAPWQLTLCVVCSHWPTLPGDPDASLIVIAEQEKAQIRCVCLCLLCGKRH